MRPQPVRMRDRFEEYQERLSAGAATPAERSIAACLRESGPEMLELRTAGAVLEDDERLAVETRIRVASEDQPFLLVTDRRVIHAAPGLLRWRIRHELPRGRVTAVEMTGPGLLRPPSLRFAASGPRELVVRLHEGEQEMEVLRDRLPRIFGHAYRESRPPACAGG